MSKRTSARCMAAAFMLINLGSGDAIATQSDLAANGAAALPNNPISIIPEQDRQAPERADTTRRVDSPAPSKTELSTERGLKQVQSSPSPNESRPIGAPPTAPPVSDSATTSRDQGLLGTLDPRTNGITKVVGALAIVVGLILLLRAVLRKSGGFLARSASRPSGVVEILAKYPMGRGQNIVLLKVARRVVLLHQAGSTMSALSEITDQDEVAALLTRLEAGSTERDAERFRKTLTQFMVEREPADERPGRTRRVSMPPAETEIVDLTRTRRGLAGMLGRRSAVP